MYERIERPLIGVLARMEAAGILVDQGELVALSADFASRTEALESEIHVLAGHPFTIGSPKQLGEVLFDEMGLQSGRKGKSGRLQHRRRQSWRSWRRRATTCRRGCSTGASSPSSRAPTPMP